MKYCSGFRDVGRFNCHGKRLTYLLLLSHRHLLNRPSAVVAVGNRFK